MGRRLDGIFRSRSAQSAREFGCIENAATSVGGTTSTKWITDERKLYAVLRDMVASLGVGAGELAVVGVVSAGLKIQFSVLGNPVGQVCVVSRGDVREIPDFFNVQRVLEVLLGVVGVKRLVEKASGIVMGAGGKAREVVERELRGGKSRRVPLLWSCDTDKEREWESDSVSG